LVSAALAEILILRRQSTPERERQLRDALASARLAQETFSVSVLQNALTSIEERRDQIRILERTLRGNWRDLERKAQASAHQILGLPFSEEDLELKIRLPRGNWDITGTVPTLAGQIGEGDTNLVRELEDVLDSVHGPQGRLLSLIERRVQQILDDTHHGVSRAASARIRALCQAAPVTDVVVILGAYETVQDSLAETIAKRHPKSPVLFVSDGYFGERLRSENLRRRIHLVRSFPDLRGRFGPVRINTDRIHLYGGTSELDTLSPSFGYLLETALSHSDEVEVVVHLESMQGVFKDYPGYTSHLSVPPGPLPSLLEFLASSPLEARYDRLIDLAEGFMSESVTGLEMLSSRHADGIFILEFLGARKTVTVRMPIGDLPLY